MRIQSINNSNYAKSVSHKAYIRKTPALDRVYDTAQKGEGLTKLVRRFSRELPNQELEIVTCDRLFNSQNMVKYGIRNNVTGQTHGVVVTSAAAALESMLCSLLFLGEDHEFFTGKKENNADDCLALLTGVIR